MPNDLIPAHQGMNRLVWDLRMNDPAQIPGAFYEGIPPRGPIVPPGRYQVRLSLAGESRTAPLTVIADPRVPGSAAAIAAKTALAIATVADIDALHKAVNAIRAARSKLDASPGSVPTTKVHELDGKLTAIEEALMQVNMKGSEGDLAFPGMLNEQLPPSPPASRTATPSRPASNRRCKPLSMSSSRLSWPCGAR